MFDILAESENFVFLAWFCIAFLSVAAVVMLWAAFFWAKTGINPFTDDQKPKAKTDKQREDEAYWREVLKNRQKKGK